MIAFQLAISFGEIQLVDIPGKYPEVGLYRRGSHR